MPETEERKDEEYMKWLEQKRALDNATAIAEQKEIDKMLAELAKMKQEKADGKQQRRQKDTRLRRHPKMLF